MEKIELAYLFMEAAHKGQLRKFTGLPYIEHLKGTANLLIEITNDTASDEQRIAALLHDVIECTTITEDEITLNFGSHVCKLVEELTNNKIEKDRMGKKFYLSNKINNMSDEALLIKFCDRLNNVIDLSDKKTPIEFVIKCIDETQYIVHNINRNLNYYQSLALEKLKLAMMFIKLNRGFQ